MLSLSMTENDGEDALREIKKLLIDMFLQGEITPSDEIYVTNARHREALQDSLNSIKLVMDSIENNMSEDLYMVDLMDAYHSLGKITGAEIGEDLIEEIFAKFCLGK